MKRASLPQTVRTLHSVRDILKFAKPHWKGFVASFALMFVASFASSGRIIMMYPIFTRVIPKTADEDAGAAETGMRAVMDKASSLKDGIEGIVDTANRATVHLVSESWLDPSVPNDRDRYATLWTVLFVWVIAMIVLAAASYLEGYVATRTMLRVLMDVRESLCRTLLDQPVAFYDLGKRGEVIQRMLGDVEAYSTGLNLVLRDVARGFFHVAITMSLMLMLSWKLSLICCLGIPFLIPLRRMTMKTLKRAHKRQEEGSRRTELVLQIFSGIRTVKAYGTEGRRIKDFRAADERVTKRALKVQRTKSAAAALTDFINNFLAMLLAVGGGWLLLQNKLGIGVGELVLFLGLTINLYQPLKRLIRQYNNLQDAMASIERTTEWINLPPGAPDAANAVPFPGLREGVRFDHVDFAYVPGQPVLRDVSFDIPLGATVALVGPSGGGKSTICDMLLRFHEPSRGRILVDGKPLSAYTRASYLAKTAMVTQAPFLFHTSIGENIRQGKLEASQAELEAAARAAQIHEFIASLPGGYDEEVGELGVRLSGGQRQRITIARALVRDPELLILDEATASLDTESEKAVQDALETLQKGRTTLVVAHRLSTVRNATRILVLDEGRIIERGTHEELIAKGRMYARLVELQDLSPTALPDVEAPSEAV